MTIWFDSIPVEMDTGNSSQPDPKRMKVSHMPTFYGEESSMNQMPCNCPPPKKGLPQEQSSAAWDGRVDNVKAWLASGGDINAINQYGGALLSAACCNGQLAVIQELIKHPNLHLNTSHEGKPALAQAIHYGHEECAEIILTSSLKCRPVLTGHWNTVIRILERLPNINHGSAAYIFSSAAQENEWFAITLLLSMDIVFTIEDLDPVLQKAYLLDEWGVVYSILRRKFRHKSECVNGLLAKLIGRRDWERVDSMLKLEKKYAKIDVSLAEACLEENEVEARQLIQNNKDPESLNGTLLVVAGGGTCEELCHLLMDHYQDYTDETVLSAIYLAAMKNSLEILPYLLERHFPRVSYQDLSAAQGVADRFGNRNAAKLLEYALDAKARKMFSKTTAIVNLDDVIDVLPGAKDLKADLKLG